MSTAITVTRNFGDGYVAATVTERPDILSAKMSGKTWILTEALARSMGASIPPPIETYAWKPELVEARGEVGSFIRVPFWRKMGPVKRRRGGRGRGGRRG